MNWDALGAIGEVIGAVAVVLSLLYVARQVRDGSKQIRLNTTSNLMTLTQDSFAPIFLSQANQDIWHSGLETPEDLTDAQFRQFLTYMDRVFYAYQLLVTQYDSGVVEDDVFNMQGAYFKYLYQTSGGQKWWPQSKLALSERVRFYLGIDDAAKQASGANT